MSKIKQKNKQTGSITYLFIGKSTNVSCTLMCSVLNWAFRCCVFPYAHTPLLENLDNTVFTMFTYCYFLLYIYVYTCTIFNVSIETVENVAQQRQEAYRGGTQIKRSWKKLG